MPREPLATERAAARGSSTCWCGQGQRVDFVVSKDKRTRTREQSLCGLHRRCRPTDSLAGWHTPSWRVAGSKGVCLGSHLRLKGPRQGGALLVCAGKAGVYVSLRLAGGASFDRDVPTFGKTENTYITRVARRGFAKVKLRRGMGILGSACECILVWARTDHTGLARVIGVLLELSSHRPGP